jgi:glycosyltransferase involved in cell wall biosynthesis
MENNNYNSAPRQESFISIVMPNYNRQKYIGEQLGSLISQTHRNWELIIVDDCSTDKSKEIIQEFIKNNQEKNIQLIQNEKTLGVAKNFEKGLGQATGKYIAVCDSDDVWFPDKLEKELSFLKSGDYGMVYSDMTVVDENLRVIEKSFIRKGLSFFCRQKDESFYELINNNHIPGPTILFRAELKNRLIPFSKHAIQDHWIAIISSIFSTIGYLDVSTVLYRQHSANMVGAEALSPIRLITKKDRIFLDKHLNLKRKSLLFLTDLSNIKGLDAKITRIIAKKIEKTRMLVNCLSDIRGKKNNLSVCIFGLWKIGAFSEIFQIAYFKLF